MVFFLFAEVMQESKSQGLIISLACLSIGYKKWWGVG
jgi:hypothetical protein